MFSEKPHSDFHNAVGQVLSRTRAYGLFLDLAVLLREELQLRLEKASLPVIEEGVSISVNPSEVHGGFEGFGGVLVPRGGELDFLNPRPKLLELSESS